MEEIIKFEDFFKKDSNGRPAEEPINRIAFTNEDIEYKLKCIKAMQKLGMVVTIYGNEVMGRT